MSGPWPLPDGWRWVAFGDVARVAADLVDPAGYLDMPHVAPNHIESGSGRLLSYTTVRDDGVTSAKHRFYAGQLLYSKIRPYLAKVVLVDFDGLCSADMYPLETSLEPRFLKWWMLTREFTRQAAGEQARTVLPKINKASLLQLLVPVPPLAEQRRVVDILEEQLTRIDAATQQLRVASRRAVRLRASTLVELWRNSAKCGSQVPVAAIGAVVTGSTPATRQGDAFAGGLVPFVAPSDVASGQRILATTRSLNALGVATARVVAEPSVAVVCIGATLGKVGWLDVAASGNQQINFVRPVDGVSPEYLAALMASPQFQRQMQDQASSTTMPILNKGKFMRLTLPVAPAAQQEALLARLRSLDEAHERLSGHVGALSARSEGLRTSLLDGAFSGRLTSPRLANRTGEMAGA